MKNIFIAAGIVGAAAALTIAYMSNRRRADAALEDIKEATKNAYRKLNRKARKMQHNANNVMQESLG